MPSHSDKQRRFMAAAAHDPAFAKRAGIPQKVAREFNQADKGKKLAEAYQGRYGLITGYDVEFHKHRDPKAYVKGLLNFLDEIKPTLPRDTDLVNLFDAVVNDVTSLKYRLENLS